MRQTHLLLSLSTFALAAAFAASAAATTTPAIIQGGGATAAQGNYAGANSSSGAPLSELSTYNSSQTAVQFSTYWGAGSGTGQTALVNNDLTCDINKVENPNGTKQQQACTPAPGGPNYVDYAFSETPVSTAVAASWVSSSYGQSVAGDLIQIPVHGTGVAIVAVDNNVAKNGTLELSDNDLCQIFSGGYTDFSQITDSKTLKPTPGPFQFVYRSDSSGGTFILTNHLAAVCNSSNTAPGVTFVATSTFATIFPSSAGGITHFIPNAVGESGFQNLADYLSNLTSTTVTQAIGYLSPDWTSIAPASDSLLSNGKPSALYVAALFNGAKAYTPTARNISVGLNSISGVATGSPSTPPSTQAQGQNPLSWVPIIQTTSLGYPIVGYGTIDIPQCFASPAVAVGFIKYLTAHYTNATYKAIQANNALAGVANTGASKFLAPIGNHILKNVKDSTGVLWNTNIQNTTVCKAAGITGR
jgi:hypothetical protein